MVYRFIEKHSSEFGTRWLLRRLNMYPNAYYNFLKSRKATYKTQKSKVLAAITSIYHEHCGVDGYRRMRVFLARKNIVLSGQTWCTDFTYLSLTDGSKRYNCSIARLDALMIIRLWRDTLTL